MPKKSMMNKNIKILKEGHLLTCWPCKINITKSQVSLMPQMRKEYSQLSWPGGHTDQIRKWIWSTWYTGGTHGYYWASLVAQMVTNLPAVQETWARSLGWRKDPLEKGMATHSSIHAWEIPWTEEPGGLQSLGSQRVGHKWATNTFTSHMDITIHKNWLNCAKGDRMFVSLSLSLSFFFLLSCNIYAAAAAAASLQSCPTLCDPIEGSPPGSPVPGILQARTLEWVAISFSNAWKWKVKVKSLSRVRL